MIDKPNGAHVSSGDALVVRENMARHVYVEMRLEEIAGRVLAMAAERGQLTSALGGKAGEKGSDIKKQRERRAYLADRLLILRKEQASLSAEKKAAAIASREGGLVDAKPEVSRK